MRFSYGVVPAFAALSVASPLQQGVDKRQAPPSTACAKVASAVQGQNPSATPTVPAQAAWDCIQSVPLKRGRALELLDSIRPYFEWQSTTAHLKDPPAEYVQKQFPAVDVWAGLDKIRDGVKNGVYKREYDYAFDLYHLLQSTHDGHFVYVMDIVGSIFTWGRPLPLVSVSENGKKMPTIFAYTDVVDKASKKLSYTPSPVKSINGEPAVGWLLKYLEIGSLQDRDALWNTIFYSLGQAALGTSGGAPGIFAGGGRGRYVYPGSHTEIGFANGTTRTLENFARILQPLDGVKTGEDLYEKYFSGKKAGGASRKDLIKSKPKQKDVRGKPWPGYPQAIERHSQNSVGGYYIPDADYADVAVLAMPSFSSEDAEFQTVVQDFIADAKKAGKKKLVIDVSANGGGTILQGYDVFKQLFPKIQPDGWTRFRNHPAWDISGQKFSQIDKNIPRKPDLSPFLLNAITMPQDYHNDVDVHGKHFKSWAGKYGPSSSFNGDEYSNIIRWDLDDPLITVSSGGIVVTGYQNRTDFEQPWKADDIVIVYDGYCASTCTIFSQLMRDQAGVQAIALGGRPQPGLTQAVGGVKGTNNFPWEFIQETMHTVDKRKTPKQAAKWEKTLAPYRSTMPFQRAGLSEPNTNARDGLRPSDPTGLPTQFVYEPADCRILYTPEMTIDATAIWKAAVDSKWRGKSHCIAGGVGGYAAAGHSDINSHELRLEAVIDAEKSQSLHESVDVVQDSLALPRHAGFMPPY